MSDLSVLAYANNFTLWHYTTPHGLESILDKDYFKSVVDMLRENDMIIVNHDTEGAAETTFFTVTNNDGVIVTTKVHGVGEDG